MSVTTQTLEIPLLCLVLAGNGLNMSPIVNPILLLNDLLCSNLMFAVVVAKFIGILVKRPTTSKSMSLSERVLCFLINSMKLAEFSITDRSSERVSEKRMPPPLKRN